MKQNLHVKGMYFLQTLNKKWLQFRVPVPLLKII